MGQAKPTRSGANRDLAPEGLVYVGDGEWLPGVPARDLSPDEAREFGAVIGANAALTGRPLYRPAQPARTEAADGAAGEE